MKAEGGCAEHQAELAEFYISKKDYVNAYAWSYVLIKRGNQGAIAINDKCASKLDKIELVKAAELGEIHLRSFRRTA